MAKKRSSGGNIFSDLARIGRNGQKSSSHSGSSSGGSSHSSGTNQSRKMYQSPKMPKALETGGSFRCAGYEINCSNLVRRSGELCSSCFARKKEDQYKSYEKPCAQSGCINTISYKKSWTNIPDYCPRCTAKLKQGFTPALCGDCQTLIWIPPGKHWRYCSNCAPKHQRVQSPRNRITERNDNRDAGSIGEDSRFKTSVWPEEGAPKGKVMGYPDTGTTTHVHVHNDGVTLSSYEEDELKGRYNFNTGEDETPAK